MSQQHNNNNNDDDQASDTSYDSQELSSMLSNMDIDNDFNTWTSFRSSLVMSGKKKQGQGAAPGGAAMSSLSPPQEEDLADDDEEEQHDIDKWKSRYCRRQEVYSKHYKPTPKESQELVDLEKFLGMSHKRPGSFGRLILGSPFASSNKSVSSTGNTSAPSSSKSLGTQTDDTTPSINCDEYVGQPAWDALIHPTSSTSSSTTPTYSIILKRGPVLCKKKECELILLTHGLVLAAVVDDNKKKKATSSSHKDSIIMRKLDTAILWPAVRYVCLGGCSEGENGDTEDGTHDDSAFEVRLTKSEAFSVTEERASSANTKFTIVLMTGDALVFECASSKSCRAWMDALERCLVQTRMHAAASSLSTAENSWTLGWQYRLVRRPAYALAVLSPEDDDPAAIVSIDMMLFHNGDGCNDDMNRSDTYNGYAPLHYAVRLNHLDAARRLLEAGANPNIAANADNACDGGDSDDGDRDGSGNRQRTPMYYAVRDELSDMISLLKRHGATSSKLAEEEQRGELFGRVAATDRDTQQKRQSEREEKERIEQEKAAKAKSQMAQNMQAMHDRGQKIEELGSKASDLNEGAANYADMARQLKQQTKKKNNFWGLF